MPSWTKPLAANVKERRLPARSERHLHVRARVDSGASFETCQEPIARFQRPESFRRITVQSHFENAWCVLAGLRSLLVVSAAACKVQAEAHDVRYLS